MDLGRPKNQSSWNQTKLAPLRQDHRVDSGHIYFFPKMDMICKSYHDLKIRSNRQKKSKSKSKSNLKGQIQR
jgi:hypothetical protein